MPCDIQHFTVTPVQFAKLVGMAQKAGLLLVGTGGDVKFRHCDFTWSYDGSILDIQCMNKPWIVLCEDINAEIDKLMSGALD